MPRTTRSAPQATPATRPAPRGRPAKKTANPAPTLTIESLAGRMANVEEGQTTVMDMLGSILKNQQEAAKPSQSPDNRQANKAPARQSPRSSPYARAAAPRPRPTLPVTTDDDLAALLTGATLDGGLQTPISFDQALDPLINQQVRGLLGGARGINGLKGRPSHPHEYVFRGPARNKTTLVSLDLAEYLFGLQRMIRDPRTPDADKIALATHINQLIEDAREYQWSQVREWSETVFSKILEEGLTWADERRIVSLRDTIAHVPAGRRYAQTELHQNFQA